MRLYRFEQVQAVLIAVVIRETMFGNIWRSINFNPYQLYQKPQNPTGTYYGTRVLFLKLPLQLPTLDII